MKYNEQLAKNIAGYLLNYEAVKLDIKEGFLWSSGWESPIYCDNRKILSYPKFRDYVKDEMYEIAKKAFPKIEVVAGVATGAIAMGVLVAQELELPFVYVRPKPKEHGLQNQIEGALDIPSNVLVIEDLISTGKSSLGAVKALREAGANVLGMISIFDYGFDEAKKNFLDAKCTLYSLSDYPALIEYAVERGDVSQENMKDLLEWRKNPAQWG